MQAAPLTLYRSATGVFYARKSAFVEANEFNIQAVDLQHPIIEMADMGGGKFVVTLDTSRGAPDAAAVLMLNSEGEVGDYGSIEVLSDRTTATNK